jgi:transcription termination factor Rho
LLGDIAVSIEANHADVRLIVMLLDERPEEITAVSRRLDGGEVIASAFDRPPEEQVAVAEMAIERAKRMVEEGEDVVILVDGLTALVRAFNLSAPAGGRLLGGGVDASAIYPSKRFFGAARALEEGGSLTMIATVTAETGSPVDELILDEFRGTATAEIRLSRHLADRGIRPAIDPETSFTRAKDQLFDAEEAAMVERFLESVKADDTLSTMQNLLAKLESTPSTAALLGSS